MFIQSASLNIGRFEFSRISSVNWIRVDGKRTKLLDEFWVLDKIIERGQFAPISLSSLVGDKISMVNEEGRQKLKDRLGNLIYPNSPLGKSLISSLKLHFEVPTRAFIRNNPHALLLRGASNVFCLLTENREDCARLVRRLREESTDMRKVMRNLGLRIRSLNTGQRFARDWISSRPSVKSFSEGRPTNDFERLVVRIVRSITGSFLSNVEVIFDDPSESTEYDLLLPLSETTAFDIELKDYRSGFNVSRKEKGRRPAEEGLKSAMLLRTMDKAARLDLQVQPVVIVRGLPKETFTQLLQIASSRGVVFLTDYSLPAKLWLLMEYGLVSLLEEDPRDLRLIFQNFSTQMARVDATSDAKNES